MEASVGTVEHIAFFDVVFDVVFSVRSSTCSDEVHFRIAYVLVDADRTAWLKRDLRNIAANSTKLIPFKQADALIRSLLLDETFSALSLAERTAVQQRILTEIKGRMLEDIVLLETKLANPKKQVFVLQFPVGEFDMVVFDPEAGSCRIFEIKHSEEAAPQQYRHLIDEQKCAQTEHRYGPITGKFVLYRGESQVIDGIQYQNVEEYLRNLA